jgi:hypothetical protein
MSRTLLPIVGSTGTRHRSSPSSRNARRALLRAAIRAEVGRVEGLVVGPRQPDPTDGAVIVEWAIERSRRNVDLSHASSDAHRSAIIGRGRSGRCTGCQAEPVGKVPCCDRVMPAPLANAVATCLSVAFRPYERPASQGMRQDRFVKRPSYGGCSRSARRPSRTDPRVLCRFPGRRRSMSDAEEPA